MTPSAVVRRWQIALIGLGVVGLLIALGQLIELVAPTRWVAIAAWLLGALVIHDGVLAIVVLGASVLVRRVKAPIPFAVIVIVQGAVVVTAIVTMLVLPAIVKQAVGSANPSVLPLDYVANLAIFTVGVAVVTALVVGGYLTVRMLRQKSPRTT